MLQQEAWKYNKKPLFIYKQWNVIVGSTFRSLGCGPDNGAWEGRGLSHYETRRVLYYSDNLFTSSLKVDIPRHKYDSHPVSNAATFLGGPDKT